jgi:Ion transport protein
LYGSEAHVRSLVVYAVLLLLFVLLTAYFTEWASSDHQGVVAVAYVLQALKCAIAAWFVAEEISEQHLIGFRNWLHDFWNIMDVCAYVALFAGTAVSIWKVETGHIVTANWIDPIAAVLLWFKLLHYMRPYKATGPLVMLIFEIISG